MSAWNLGRDDGGGWDDAAWNFDDLDDEWYDPFDGMAALSPHPPESAQASSSFTVPPPRPRNNDDPRANGASSFFDNLLHATAPQRHRPQPRPPPADAQATRTPRHPADRPRQTIRPNIPHLDRPSISGNRSQQSHFGYLPNALFDDLSDEDDTTPQSTQPSTRISNRASEEFVTLEDDSDQEDMPATRRGYTARGTGVVDLTAGAPASDSSQRRPRARKRSAEDSVDEGPATKRGRASQGDIEEIDLSNDAPSAEEDLRQQQQRDIIKQQQADEANNGPLKIGQRTCIICMENFTNCTIASCGHFYCHECLIQALLAGEKNSDRGTGTCPQCRKPLTRNNKKKRDIIPLSFMKKATFEKNQRKRLQAS